MVLSQSLGYLCSELEDLIIVKAVEMKGRDWRAVLTFMKQNCTARSLRRMANFTKHVRSGTGECRTAFENGLPSVAPQQRQGKVSMFRYFKMHVIL